MDQEFFTGCSPAREYRAGKQISRKQQQRIWKALRMRLGVR